MNPAQDQTQDESLCMCCCDRLPGTHTAGQCGNY